MLRRFKRLLKLLFGVMAAVLCVDFCFLYAKTTRTAALQKTEIDQKVKPSAVEKEVSLKKNSDKKQVVEAKKSTAVAQPPISTKSKKSNKSKLSLEEIHARSLKERSASSGVPTRSKSFTPAELASDLYTQSQAHMSVPEIKQLIEKTYNIKPYQALINSVLAREKEYENEYVFYHGLDNVWRVPQDLYTRLYFHFNPAQSTKNFIFLRFEDVKGPSSVQDFLISELNTKGLINDHSMGLFLIAVNLALFGNVGVQPECTWQYFIKSRGHTNPNRAIYEKIMDAFGLTHKYIDELISLVDLYQTKEQTILQIFVPKDKVDSIGYLAWIRGNPAHQKTMDAVLHDVENKKFEKTAPALDYYTRLFRNEQEKNNTFKHLLERVKAGEFSLSYFLNFYRNMPDAIADINHFQARLIVTPEVLLNPLSGVKMFRYSTATSDQLKKYQQKFDAIIKKMIDEKKK